MVKNYSNRNIASRSAIKLDFQKDFDSIDWEYLFMVMQAMDFLEVYMSWIRACLSTAFFSVSLFGALLGNFEAKKGVRQGDPLSPYLFTIALEPLTGLLDETTQQLSLPITLTIRS
ncbi:unnamed protein product [Linum trigynum]|uniref:Reverse transcriptase domain-containing protein n=1 Tax=Linum trigynum TaxID=586398 RepID=A0AAV2CFW7_9ROSI